MKKPTLNQIYQFTPEEAFMVLCLEESGAYDEDFTKTEREALEYIDLLEACEV
jgi:hypothetical protein